MLVGCKSHKQNLILVVDKLSPVSNMASSRSEENGNLKHFQHLVVSQCWCVLQFFSGLFCFGVFSRCYSLCFWPMLLCLAEVIAMCHIVVDVGPPGRIL